MGSMSVMEGNEILLRPLVKPDLHDFANLVTDPLYGKYSPLGQLTNDIAKEIVDNILANYDANGYEFWVAVDKKKDTIAGFVGYHPVIFENKTHEMYFVGFYTRYWGSRFPEQATQFICDYAFNKGKISQLLAFVHPDDTASLMCAQIIEAKFQKEAQFFGASLFIFSIDKKDFKKIN